MGKKPLLAQANIIVSMRFRLCEGWGVFVTRNKFTQKIKVPKKEILSFIYWICPRHATLPLFRNVFSQKKKKKKKVLEDQSILHLRLLLVLSLLLLFLQPKKKKIVVMADLSLFHSWV